MRGESVMGGLVVIRFVAPIRLGIIVAVRVKEVRV